MAQMSKTKKPAGAFRTVRRMETTPQRKLTTSANAKKTSHSDSRYVPRVNPGRYRGGRKGSI